MLVLANLLVANFLLIICIPPVHAQDDLPSNIQCNPGQFSTIHQSLDTVTSQLAPSSFFKNLSGSLDLLGLDRNEQDRKDLKKLLEPKFESYVLLLQDAALASNSAAQEKIYARLQKLISETRIFLLNSNCDPEKIVKVLEEKQIALRFGPRGSLFSTVSTEAESAVDPDFRGELFKKLNIREDFKKSVQDYANILSQAKNADTREEQDELTEQLIHLTQATRDLMEKEYGVRNAFFEANELKLLKNTFPNIKKKSVTVSSNRSPGYINDIRAQIVDEAGQTIYPVPAGMRPAVPNKKITKLPKTRIEIRGGKVRDITTDSTAEAGEKEFLDRMVGTIQPSFKEGNSSILKIREEPSRERKEAIENASRAVYSNSLDSQQLANQIAYLNPNLEKYIPLLPKASKKFKLIEKLLLLKPRALHHSVEANLGVIKEFYEEANRELQKKKMRFQFDIKTAEISYRGEYHRLRRQQEKFRTYLLNRKAYMDKLPAPLKKRYNGLLRQAKARPDYLASDQDKNEYLENFSKGLTEILEVIEPIAKSRSAINYDYEMNIASIFYDSRIPKKDVDDYEKTRDALIFGPLKNLPEEQLKEGQVWSSKYETLVNSARAFSTRRDGKNLFLRELENLLLDRQELFRQTAPINIEFSKEKQLNSDIYDRQVGVLD